MQNDSTGGGVKIAVQHEVQPCAVFPIQTAPRVPLSAYSVHLPCLEWCHVACALTVFWSSPKYSMAHTTVWLTVPYDEYSTGGAFDTPVRNILYECVPPMYVWCCGAYIYLVRITKQLRVNCMYRKQLGPPRCWVIYMYITLTSIKSSTDTYPWSGQCGL